MRRRSILVLVVFFLAAAPVNVVIWTQIVPKYQAKREVRVRPIIPYLVFKTEDSGTIPFYDSYVNTQVAIIKSSVVLQRALERQDVKETQWYKNPPKSHLQSLQGDLQDPSIERLVNNLSVQPRKETELIDVSFVDYSVKDARIILNAVLEEYIKYIEEKSDADEDKLYHQLTEQYTSLQTQIRGQEVTSARLREYLGTTNPQELISAKRLRLDQTQARLGELQQRIALLEWEVKQAIISDSNKVASGEIEKQPKYHMDVEWRKQNIEVMAIRHNIEISRLDTAHPEMIRAQKDLKFAEEVLRLREEQLDEQWQDRPKNVAGVPLSIVGGSDPNYVKAVIEHQLARAKQEERLLIEENYKQNNEFKRNFADAQLLEKENNSLLQKRELLNAVRQRIDQKNMERNVSAGSIEISAQAYASSEPYKDPRIIYTAISLVLGLVIALGTGFIFRRRAG